MELKSLFLGLTFTTGIFALKSGVGLHYPDNPDKLKAQSL
jgi:hypothetical protein